MKRFFHVIGIWDIVEKGFMEPKASSKSSNDLIKELKRNRQLDCKTFNYLNTQIQLHVANKFIHAKTANEAWIFLIYFYSHGREEICDEKEKKRIF